MLRPPGQGKPASTQLSAGPSTGLRTGFGRLRLRTEPFDKAQDRPVEVTGPAPAVSLLNVVRSEISALEALEGEQ